MTLYEINQAILDTIDPETGEIVDIEKLSELQMEREQKLESVALWVKNLNAEAEAYKAEKEAFAEREKAAKNKAESLKKWLVYALNGEKMSTQKVAISFRKSESVEIEDEERVITFAQKNGRDDLLSYKAPTVNKSAIKAVIKTGKEIPGAVLVEKQNIQIK
jgi:hypothetical protein